MTLTTHTPVRTNLRRPVQALALAWVAYEVVLAFIIEVPVAALIFAALFLVGAWWVSRPGVGGLLLVAALSTLELVFIPTYPRDSAGDWVTGGIALVLSLATLGACWRSRRS